VGVKGIEIESFTHKRRWQIKKGLKKKSKKKPPKLFINNGIFFFKLNRIKKASNRPPLQPYPPP